MQKVLRPLLAAWIGDRPGAMEVEACYLRLRLCLIGSSRDRLVWESLEAE
jgi:hypothetical protein